MTQPANNRTSPVPTREERKRELERKGDKFPVCDRCYDGSYRTFPHTCPCGRGS